MVDLNGVSDEEVKGEMFYLVYLEAIITAVFALPNFLLFKDHPPTPPRFFFAPKFFINY